jgi:hypothetical protein
VSRPALGLIQTPIHWVPEALFPVLKRPERKTYHSPPTSAEVKNDGAISPLPLSPHGLVFNSFSTGTTYLFLLNDYLSIKTMYLW